MSSKYIKLCEKCDNILNKQINGESITFKCQACQFVYSSNEEDTLLLEVYNETINTMTKKKGELIYFNDSNPKDIIKCINPKCDVEIVRFERESDGRKKYGCKCGTVWVINKSYN